MDAVTELATATVEALTRDYYLWVAIFAIFPKSIDFFENPDPTSASMKASRERVRSEPPEDQPQ